jgi:hypothetical protein
VITVAFPISSLTGGGGQGRLLSVKVVHAGEGGVAATETRKW